MIWCIGFFILFVTGILCGRILRTSEWLSVLGMSPSVHKKPASISVGARQRQGVTYSCVRLEFYPNYNRFYQISAEIGHTPLHTFSLHTSAMVGLLDIDGTWLESDRLSMSRMFMSHCFLLRVFENVLAVTFASLFADRANAHWRQSEWAKQWPMLSQPTMETSILWIFTTFLSLMRRKSIFLGSCVKTDGIHW